tara:strand:+ start:264 stop:608 length:345 start_codon:yes stop_codon:yes gene_type:complete
MSVEKNIKEWVILDNQQKKINEQIKSIRDKKNSLSTDIMNHFNERNLNNPIINISDGKLSFTETKVANVLTYKFLEDCLNEYFKDDTSKELLKFIKNKRTYTTSNSIKRVYNKE